MLRVSPRSGQFGITRQGVHGEQITVDLEETRLLGAHPFGVPGHIDRGDPAILLQSVGAGVGNQAALQSGPLSQGLRRLPAPPPA